MTARMVVGSIEFPAGSGTPCVGARVVAQLYSAGQLAYGTSNDVAVGSTAVLTDNAGAWTLLLEPNANITPSGTVWKITQTPPGGAASEYYITVPDTAGALDVTDLLDDPPTAVPSTALASHVADIAAHGASGYVDVASTYLVHGDGTDEWAQIQQAFDDAAAESWARPLLFREPESYFAISQPLDVLGDNARIVGLGSVEIRNTTSGSDVFRFNYGQASPQLSPSISGLRLRGTGSTSVAIRANMTTYLSASDLDITTHPGRAIELESTGVALVGCAFSVFERVRVTPSAAVTAVLDNGGLHNVFRSCAIREAEVGVEFRNAKAWKLDHCRIESNNRGSLQTGVLASTTDDGSTSKSWQGLGQIEGCYLENNPLYAVDAQPGNRVEIIGGFLAAGVTAGVKGDVVRLAGGGLVRGVEGFGGGYIKGAGVEIVDCSGIYSDATHKIAGVSLPIGSHLSNSATNPWIDSSVSLTAAGTSPPATSFTTSQRFYGVGSMAVVFPSNDGQYDSSRVLLANAAVTPTAGDVVSALLAVRLTSGTGIVARLVSSSAMNQVNVIADQTGWYVVALRAVVSSTASTSVAIHTYTTGQEVTVHVGGVAISTGAVGMHGAHPQLSNPFAAAAGSLPTASAAYRSRLVVKSGQDAEDRVCVCVLSSDGSTYKWIDVKDGSTVT